MGIKQGEKKVDFGYSLFSHLAQNVSLSVITGDYFLFWCFRTPFCSYAPIKVVFGTNFVYYTERVGRSGYSISLIEKEPRSKSCRSPSAVAAFR